MLFRTPDFWQTGSSPLPSSISVFPAASQKSTKSPQRYLAWLKSKAPDGYSYDSLHFHAIADLVDKAILGDIDRARIHMPPGHAKTETVTWRLPTYIWQNVDPKARILLTCHSQDYARELGWAVREVALQSGIELREDTRAKDAFRTTEGGFLKACGVGATPTGRRFHYILGDDPIKDRKQIESAVTRKSMDQWFTQGIMSRLLPGGKVFLIFTRWHEDDLGGRLDAREQVGGDKYFKLILKAICEDEDDALGRKIGEPLWPQVYSLEELLRRKLNMIDEEGERGWRALFQQDPTPATGDLFNVDEIVYVDEIPEGLPAARAWDVGASPSGDPTAGLKLEGPCKDDFYYVSHIRRDRMDTASRDSTMLGTAMLDGTSVQIGVPQDPGAAGLSQVKSWQRLLTGFRVTVLRPDKKKEIRAGPVSSLVNSGRLRVKRAEWTPAFIDELRTFPGRHDDQVDALSDAYELLTRRTRLKFAVAKRQTEFVDPD